MASDAGKGDTPRPLSIPLKEFEANFERIFGKKEKVKKSEKTDPLDKAQD